MLGYTVSKFAMAGLSEALRVELTADGGPLVTTVVPGPMRTGSFYNAEFMGRQREEFAWFSVLSSLPILSADAHRAARTIVQAMREGRAEVHIGLSGHVLPLLHGLAPRLLQHFGSWIASMLPPPTEDDERWKGREINSTLPGSLLLELGDRAARENNEEPPEEHVRG
jgi:short-subunit dehydrogenase